MYISCVFFSFLNCLILLMFPIVHYYYFGMKTGLQTSPETQFSYIRGEKPDVCLWYTLLWH